MAQDQDSAMNAGNDSHATGARSGPVSCCPLPPVTYDSALIETVVRRRVDAAAREDAGWIGEYRRELDAVYELTDANRPFDALDRRYFQRIGIPTIVSDCLAERAPELSGASSIAMLTAQSRSHEGVDVTKDKHLAIRFRPSSLDNMEILRRRIRRELIQAADCLSPAFGHLPDVVESMLPSEKERVRKGLSSLWALSAQIRLCMEEVMKDPSAGSAPPAPQVPMSPTSAAACSRDDLARLTADAIDTLGEGSAAAIDRLFSGMPGRVSASGAPSAGVSDAGRVSASGAPSAGVSDAGRPPTFRQMLDLCREFVGSEKIAAGICDLCRFPAEDAVPLSSLSPQTRAALKTEFTQLRNSSPVCRRCVERQDFVLRIPSKKEHRYD